MLPVLRRFLDRRRLRDPRFAPMFEPYRGSELVSLDLETTSLDPADAQVLTIAAVPVDAHGVRLSERFVRLVRSDRDYGIDSIRVHRILPGESATGVDLDQALDELLLWLGNRTLLGYYLAFDMAVINRLARARHGFRLPNRGIELSRIYARGLPVREGHTGHDLRLETIARSVGVPLMGRHTALGDAVSVGLIHAALQRRSRRSAVPARRGVDVPAHDVTAPAQRPRGAGFP
jgi:DNA polymerase III subunit epsilon